MMKRWRLPALVLGLAAVLAAACDAPWRQPLRLGISVWPGYEFLYLAGEKGFFADAGARVKLVEYGSLGDVQRAFQREQVDAMTSTLIEVLQACHLVARCPRPALVTNVSDGADRIIADSSVATVADLEGRRVAAEPASLGSYVLVRALASAGLGIQDVTVVPMDVREMPHALRDKRVDAVVSYPPHSTDLLEEAAFNTVFSSADIPGEVVDVVSFSATALAERPEDVRGILRAWDRAVHYARANPDDAWRIMAERENVAPVDFAASLGGLKIHDLQEQAPLFEEDGPLDTALHTLRGILVRADLLAPDTPVDLAARQPLREVLAAGAGDD